MNTYFPEPSSVSASLFFHFEPDKDFAIVYIYINHFLLISSSQLGFLFVIAIYEILNEKSEEEHSRRYAELLSKNVQWYYVDGDGEVPYDNETNAKIEHAFENKKPSVIILLAEESDDKPTRYEIDFNTNVEKNLDTGDTTRVERKETTTGTITIQSFNNSITIVARHSSSLYSSLLVIGHHAYTRT
jgi:hypothetical protein